MQKIKRVISWTFILLFMVLLISISPKIGFACPAHGEPVSCKQPNGEIITIRKVGDEFFNYYADTNNNPLLEDEKGVFRYVVLDSKGMKLGNIASDAVSCNKNTRNEIEDFPDFKTEYWNLEKLIEKSASTDNELSKKELNETEEFKSDSVDDGAIYSELLDSDVLDGELSTLPSEPFEPRSADLEIQALPFNIPLLVLRVTFNNVPSKSTDATWTSRVFNSATGVKAFYTETSNGKTTFSKASETQGTANDGIVHVKLNEPYPNGGIIKASGDNNVGAKKAATAIKKALIAADNTINYAQFDRNGNGVIDKDELAICVIFSGFEFSFKTNNSGIWAHQWDLNSAGVGMPILDGIKINRYAVSGERLSDTKLAAISTMCHELGHVLGLPDLYNTDTNSSTYFNVERLSLMAGSWGARKNTPGESLPQHLDPWSKIKLGFYSPTLVSSSKNYILYKSSDKNTYSILKIPTQKASEYYLIENRQYTGFDAALYGEWNASGAPYNLYTDSSGTSSTGGIVIWRIDEAIISSQSAINGSGHTPGVMPIYIGNKQNVPFREPGKTGNIFNYSLNDYANKYTVSLIDKQLTVTSKASDGSIAVGVKAGKAIPAKRLSGATRYETAAAISKDGWVSAKNVVLASGEKFPDGLAAAPLAKILGAPILLANQTNTLPKATADEIKRLGATTIHIVGGTPVITAAVESSLKAGGKVVKRYAGATRYETAQKIANTLPSYATVIVANSSNFPDALSASAGAGCKGFPILYVAQDSIPAATQSIINKSTVKNVIVIGSTAAVSAGVFNNIKASGKTVIRLQGATRYETNIAVQKYFFPNTSNVGYVATGQDFPDALGAGSAAAKGGVPLLLTSNTLTGYPATTKQFIKEKNLSSLKAAGSTTVISNQILRHLQTVM